MALLREVMPDYQDYLDLGMSKDEVRNIAKSRVKLQKQKQIQAQQQILQQAPQQNTVKDGAFFRGAQGITKGAMKNTREISKLYDDITTSKATPYLVQLQKNNIPLDTQATLPSDFSQPVVIKDGKPYQDSTPKLKTDAVPSSLTKFTNKTLNTIQQDQNSWQKRHPNQTDYAGQIGQFAGDMATDPVNYTPLGVESRALRLAGFSAIGGISGGMDAYGEGGSAKDIAKSAATGAVLAPIMGESFYMLSKGAQKLYGALAKKLKKNPKVADTLEAREVSAEIKAHEEDAQIKEKIDIAIKEGATPEQLKEIRKQNINIDSDDAHISEVLNDGAILEPEMAGFHAKVLLANSIKSKRYTSDEFLSKLKNEYNLQDEYALKMTEAYTKEDPNILMDWAHKKLKDHNTQTKTYDNLDSVLKEEQAQTKKLQEGVIPKEENIAQNIDTLQAHPRYNEVIDNARDRKSTDTKYPQKQIQTRSGDENYNAGGLYAKNYDYGFQLTKSDVKNIEAGKITPEIEAKIQNDLGVMDNNPDWQTADKNALHVNDIPMDAQGNILGADGNVLFAKGADNLAVATAMGTEVDDNGNISFSPEKFILGLGGYTVAKKFLKSNLIQDKVKNIIAKSITKIQAKSKNILEQMKDEIDYHKLNKEEQKIYDVYLGKRNIAQIKSNDIGDIITLETGTRKKGARKIIIKHGGVEKTGGLSPLELVKVGEIVRKGKLAVDSFTETQNSVRYGYDLQKKDNLYRVVVEEFNDGKKIFDYYSDRNFIDYKKRGEQQLNPHNEIIPKDSENIKLSKDSEIMQTSDDAKLLQEPSVDNYKELSIIDFNQKLPKDLRLRTDADYQSKSPPQSIHPRNELGWF